jgi:hypothetical protein
MTNSKKEKYMKKIIPIVLVFALVTGCLYSQELPAFKLSGRTNFLTSSNYNKSSLSKQSLFDKSLQLKTRKTVTSYFGAGYAFIIFTASYMNKAYPVLDFSSGDFLSEINLFYGFAVAKAVTFEIEPSILFTRNNRNLTIELGEPINGYRYVHPTSLSMLAFPLAVNVRFFPLYQLKTFGRLFFVGGGAGAVWTREEYDNYYNNNPSGFYYNENYMFATESTSQWSPLFRIMAGFTGTGGAFGFGGELRYNFVPLKQSNEPFVTRYAPNYNSVDLSLRFYFSL